MRDDEGCQGNPPCQPASAYFSLLALAINTASPGELPDQTQTPLRPFCPPPPAAPHRTSPEPFSSARLLLLTCLSTCALPSTVTNQPPSPPRIPLLASPHHLVIPFSVYLRVCFPPLLSIFTLPRPPPPLPFQLLMNLSRKSRFMQCVLETLLNLFIYELSLVQRSLQRS